jgi:hypothetical protein
MTPLIRISVAEPDILPAEELLMAKRKSPQPNPPLAPPAPSESWSKRNSHWVSVFVAASVPAIMIMLFIYGQAGNYVDLHVDRRIDLKISNLIDRVGDVDSRLARVETTLDHLTKLVEPLIIDVMRKSAALTQPDFDGKLDEIRGVLHLASGANIRAPEVVLRQLETKLLSSSNREVQYWSTAASLVTYKSSLLPAVGQLPSCFEKEPTIKLARDIGPTDLKIEITTAAYENCEFVIDSIEAAATRKRYLNLTGLELKNGRVVYRGGDVLFPYGAAGVMAFVNCTFSISVHEVPPAVGRQFIRQLVVAKNLSNVRFKSEG